MSLFVVSVVSVVDVVNNRAVTVVLPVDQEYRWYSCAIVYYIAQLGKKQRLCQDFGKKKTLG